jgi:alpha-glucosidase
MKKIFLIFLLFANLVSLAQIQRQIKSPDGNLRIVIAVGRELQYSIYFYNHPLLLQSAIDLTLQNGITLGKNLIVRKISIRRINDSITSPVPEKRKLIRNYYSEIRLDFKNGFAVQFRAFDDGAAYRLITTRTDSLKIMGETAKFRFSKNYPAYFPEVQKRNDADSFHTSFEEPYQHAKLDSIPVSTLCFSPVLVDCENGNKVLLTESDLEEYPGMFLRSTGSQGFEGSFAHFPIAQRISEGEYPQAIITERAPYIALTRGNRTFPWRVIAISNSDKDLPSTDIVYRLASPSRVKDPSWIHPGKATDEWIIGINLFNIPFVAGINTATYKYYIDFAKRFGFDRIMMDAGWSESLDLFKINPNLNMDELASYAKSKGIRISMWTLALTLDRQLDSALDQFAKWGVDFIMTDFIDRDDQKAVQFYFRIAEACAKKNIMIMYHGAYKPAGFGRTYPNAITRESVLGSEYNIWSDKANPSHDLLLPFIRMVSGPMDYEPGILDNATKRTFRPISEKVMSQGTRCHQLAMFVVYDNPMQIFSGNPSQGLLEPAFMELLGSIPTTWDETLIPAARVGDYLITARKKGDDWFIGGLTNWDTRTIPLVLDFLDPGSYHATICADGVNADRYASDYLITEKTIRKNDTLMVNMANGGGWLLRLRKVK